MTKKYLSFVSKLVLILSIPFFLVLTNIYFLFSASFVRYEYQKEGFPQSGIFNEEERLSIANAIIDYLKTDKDITTLQNDYLFFNERELSHLVDVKFLVNRMFAVQKFSGVLIALSMFALLTEKNRKRMFFYVFLGCLITILIVGIVIILAYLNFDCFFVRFHQLFFFGDSWLFYPSDTLIQLFPRKFWFDSIRLLMFLTVSEALLIAFIMQVMTFKYGEKLNKS